MAGGGGEPVVAFNLVSGDILGQVGRFEQGNPQPIRGQPDKAVVTARLEAGAWVKLADVFDEHSGRPLADGGFIVLVSKRAGRG